MSDNYNDTCIEDAWKRCITPIEEGFIDRFKAKRTTNKTNKNLNNAQKALNKAGLTDPTGSIDNKKRENLPTKQLEIPLTNKINKVINNFIKDAMSVSNTQDSDGFAYYNAFARLQKDGNAIEEIQNGMLKNINDYIETVVAQSRGQQPSPAQPNNNTPTQ